jgi:AraC-like DNA-binding protein
MTPPPTDRPMYNLPISRSATVASQTVIPPPGAVRLGPVLAVPTVLRQLGHDPRPVLRRAGFSLNSLRDPDTVVPIDKVGRLLSLCAEVTSCVHFGLLVGQHVTTSALGVMGLLIQNAADVETALSNLVRYRSLNDRGALITLERDAALARLQYSMIDYSAPGAGQMVDCAIAIGYNILRSLCGHNWAPKEITLAHGRPADSRPLHNFFRCPVRFDAVNSSILFNRHWLKKSTPDADPHLYGRILREVRQLQRDEPADADEILLLMRTLLRGGLYNQEKIAALLGVNRRTLGRKLLSAGTTFRGEVEAMRFAQAMQLLADATLNTKQIAFTLGYADVSAFSHAFKRWCDMSPGQWRDQSDASSSVGVHSIHHIAGKIAGEP